MHTPIEEERMNWFGHHKFELQRKDDQMLKARIEAAVTLFQIHNQARSQISEEIMERKMDRDKVTTKLKYLSYPPQCSYKQTIGSCNMAIEHLQCALYDLDGSKQIATLHYQMKHCCSTMAKERQLIRRIKEAAREKLLADAAVKAKKTNHLGSKEAIEDRIKHISIDRERLKKKDVDYRSKVKHLKRELEAIDNDLRRLQRQLAAVNQI